MEHPTFGNGKICYLEIPAADIQRSSEFYRDIFGWKIRSDNQGNVTFDDGVGEVSGMWEIGPKPATDPGIVISIMVDDIETTIKLIIAHGGTIVLPYNKSMSIKVARFADPFGNVFGLYQHGG
ncbi:MAG: VOC family protein [Chitinophagaceae bacterium]